MKPLDPGAGTVEVGRYVLEVGGPAGTIVSGGERERPTEPNADLSADAADSLADALEKHGSAGESTKAPAATGGDLVDDASEVTAKIERADALFKGHIEGNALDPGQLSLEIDVMVGLLERLDRTGRWEEALRLARTISKLLSLLKRWESLLKSLWILLRAGEKLGDLEAIALAKHELGTLQVAVEDVTGAERNLGEARAIRERVGDRRGLAATNRNGEVLCQQLRQMLREGRLVPRSRRFPRILRHPVPVVLAAVALIAAGVAGGAVVGSDTATAPGDVTVTDNGGGGGGGGGGSGGGGANGDGGGGGGGGGNGAGGGGGGDDDEDQTEVLSVTIEGEGSGTVTSSPPGIACGEICTAEFPADEVVTLTAEPDKGWEFYGFTGCSNAECTVTTDMERSVTATFGPPAVE